MDWVVHTSSEHTLFLRMCALIGCCVLSTLLYTTNEQVALVVAGYLGGSGGNTEMTGSVAGTTDRTVVSGTPKDVLKALSSEASTALQEIVSRLDRNQEHASTCVSCMCANDCPEYVCADKTIWFQILGHAHIGYVRAWVVRRRTPSSRLF